MIHRAARDLAIASIVLGMFAASSVQAGPIYTTGFEFPTFAPGSINGQAGWSGDPAPVIQTGVVRSGTQALRIDASVAAHVEVSRNLGYAVSGQTVIMRADFLRTGAGTSQASFYVNSDTGFLAQIATGPGGAFRLGGYSSSTPYQFFTAEVWHQLEIRFDFPARIMEGFVDGQSLGTLTIDNPTFPTTLNSVLCSSFGDGTTLDLYFDNVSVTSAAPGIVSITDVKNDQGGKVSLRWTASGFDQVPGNSINEYWIWRQVPIQMAVEALGSGATLVREGAGAGAPSGRAFRTTTEAAEVYYWEYVGSQVAHGFSAYSYTAATLSDSVSGSNPYTLFMVEAENLPSGEYWSSAPDSGYSVDNLPPGPPAPVAGAYSAAATHLHWGANSEADFAMYRIYRGGSAGFVPGPGNLVASQPDTGYADPGPAGNFYKLSAVDAHGNESDFTLLTPAGTTGVVEGGPVTFALEGVRPNPASGGGLNVSFALPTAAAARLELLDLSGRRVLSREVGALGAGRHTVNLAEGRRVSPGVYWVRLAQGVNQRGTRVAVIH